MSARTRPNLRGFIEALERDVPDDVWRVPDEVDPDYEISAFTMELERRGQRPLLWFEKVRGARFPVVTNVFAERGRFARALGVPLASLDEEWLAREDRRIAPVLRDHGPIHDVVLTGADLDLGRLPIFRHFTEDAGPYITNGIVVAKDPDTGVRNASFHRMQVKGRARLGTSLHSRRHLWDYQRRAETRGEPVAVSILIGAHPLFHFGAGLWKGPIDVDEYEVAGGFLGEPLEITPGVTVSVEAPADAEFVVEGHILPEVREPEGPFAEFTGYASERSTRHVIEVTAILHRADAIYQDVMSGISAEHTTLLAVPSEARLLRVLRGHHPGARRVPAVGDVPAPLLHLDAADGGGTGEERRDGRVRRGPVAEARRGRGRRRRRDAGRGRAVGGRDADASGPRPRRDPERDGRAPRSLDEGRHHGEGHDRCDASIGGISSSPYVASGGDGARGGADRPCRAGMTGA